MPLLARRRAASAQNEQIAANEHCENTQTTQLSVKIERSENPIVEKIALLG
jgi:hypothetical protein